MDYTIDELVQQILEDDTRFHPNAYLFLLQALNHASKNKVKNIEEEPDNPEKKHISGQQLLESIRVLALLEFGYLARAVFNSWGIAETYSWGEIVYNMISKKLLTKSDKDNRQDFKDVFDLEKGLDNAFFKEEYFKTTEDTIDTMLI